MKPSPLLSLPGFRSSKLPLDAAVLVIASVLGVGGHAARAANYNYSGQTPGSTTAPATGVFTLGFNGNGTTGYATPTGTGSGLLFGGTTAYTATDDQATLSIAGLTFNNTGAVTVATSAAANNLTQSANTSIQLNNTGTVNLAPNIADAGFLTTFQGNGGATYSGVLSGSNSATISNLGGTTFTGVNTYTGQTTVNRFTLTLDFTAQAAGTANLIRTGSTINLNGGTLALRGNTTGTSAQTFGTTSLTANSGSFVTATSNGGTLNLALGAITRNAGTTVDFTLPALGSITTTSATATGGVLTSTAGAAFATTNGGTSFAARSTTTGAQAITALATYSTGTANYVAGNNVDVASGDSVNAVTVNTLRFNAANDALTLAGANTISTGAVLVTPTGAGSSITGGSITAPTGVAEVLLHNYGSLSVGSAITNNGTTATRLTLDGPGTTTLTGANTYTGQTTVSGGPLILASGSTTTGSIVVSGGGSLNEAAGFVIGGAATLTVSGNNTSVLNGANTFTGGTTIGSGSLGGIVQITNSAGLGTGAVALVSTNSASSQAGVQLNFATPASGVGSSAANPNVIANNFTGNAQNTLAGGGFADIESVAGFNRLSGTYTQTGTGGTGPIIVADAGSSLEVAGNLTVGNAITGTRGFDFGGAGNIVLSGVFSTGTATVAALQKDNTGTLTITGANTYAGTTTLNGGTTTVSGNGTLGAATTTLAVNSVVAGTGAATVLNLSPTLDTTTGNLSGTVSQTGVTTGANTATVNTGGAGRNFTVNQTGATNFGGVIAGAGNFALGTASTSTLTLSGANTYTGTTTVGAGTLSLAAAGTNNGTAVTPGTLTAATPLTVNTGGTLLLAASNAASPGSTLGLGGGTLTVANGVLQGSGATVTGATPGSGAPNGAGANVTGLGMLALTANSALTFAGASGTVVFSGFTPGGFVLTVNGSNFAGTDGTGNSADGTTDRLIFAANQAANIAAGAFAFPGATGPVTETALGNGDFEVLAAVPEPAADVAVLGGACLLVLVLRRRHAV